MSAAPVSRADADAAIPVLAILVCAPITTSVRSSAASLDNRQVIPKSELTSRVARLRLERLDERCEAARAAIDC